MGCTNPVLASLLSQHSTVSPPDPDALLCVPPLCPFALQGRKKWRETIRVLPQNISLKAWLSSVGRGEHPAAFIALATWVWLMVGGGLNKVPSCGIKVTKCKLWKPLYNGCQPASPCLFPPTLDALCHQPLFVQSTTEPTLTMSGSSTAPTRSATALCMLH